MLIDNSKVSRFDAWQGLQHRLYLRAVRGSAKKDEQKAIHFDYFGKYCDKIGAFRSLFSAFRASGSSVNLMLTGTL